MLRPNHIAGQIYFNLVLVTCRNSFEGNASDLVGRSLVLVSAQPSRVESGSKHGRGLRLLSRSFRGYLVFIVRTLFIEGTEDTDKLADAFTPIFVYFATNTPRTREWPWNQTARHGTQHEQHHLASITGSTSSRTPNEKMNKLARLTGPATRL